MPVNKALKSLRSFFLFLSFLLFLGGCGASHLFDQREGFDQIRLNSSSLAGAIKSSEEAAQDAERRPLFYKPFPMDSNNSVAYWIRYFSKGKGRSSMKVYLERSNRYLEAMVSIFREMELPADLVYIAMLESAFRPWAKSHAEAVGYWQFTADTGRRYGLKINKYVDERRDFVLSTKAAARYLRDLYSIFWDWRLSMAGYNAGEKRVSDAIVYYRSRNFWYLSRKKALPEETRKYVPKVIAMRKIALDPAFYGFSNINYHEPVDYDLFLLEKPSSLLHISKKLGIAHEELRRLNPKFNTDRLPSGKPLYIRTPAGI